MDMSKDGLYKFYKYMTYENAIKTLSNGQLFYRNPVNFNDPYDTHPKNDRVIMKKAINLTSKKVIDDFVEPGSIPKHLLKKRKKTYLSFSTTNDFRRILLNEMVITCFSQSPFILPMWAHYADNHKGVVVEFIIEAYMIEEYHKNLTYPYDVYRLIPMDVDYTDERPDPFLEDATNNYFAACLTKARSWSYEQEVRTVTYGKEGLIPFDRMQVRRVFGGLRLDDQNKQNLKKLIQHLNHENSFKMKYKDITLLHDRYILDEI